MLRRPSNHHRRLHLEPLEDRRLLAVDVSLVYELLNERTTFNEDHFFVYLDADSGFNHGFPSGFIASAGRNPGDVLKLNTACVDDPAASSGCSVDPNALDREHGTVISLSVVEVGAYAGVIFVDPELTCGPSPGMGYDLRSATHVVFDARTPTPGGIRVEISVGGKNSNSQFISGMWSTFSIPLSGFRDPDPFSCAPDELANIHQLFGVVFASQFSSDGDTILLDNIRFDPLPTNPTGARRLSFPSGNEVFGAVPAVIEVADDSGAGFSTNGNWNQQFVPQAYLGDHHRSFGAAGSALATWTFSDLEPRVYVVEATWVGNAGNATSAQYRLLSDAAPPVTVLMDQTETLQEGNAAVFDQHYWRPLGEILVTNPGTLTVELSNSGADGMVVADAVRIVPTIPSDQAIRNLTTTYESALTVLALLDRRNDDDLVNARLIVDTMLYALENDNLAGVGGLPKAPDGARGLRDAYSNGDVAWFNNQGGDDGAMKGYSRLAGFSSDGRLCVNEFCSVLDGAFGGNDAFGIMALMAAYSEFGDAKYLDGAREIGNWIYGNLVDLDGPAFDPPPEVETFGGYFLGFADGGVDKSLPENLLRGKSIENNADMFSVFSMIASAETELGNHAEAAKWTQRADIAGDFVMALYDPGDPSNSRDGRFFTGTLRAANGFLPQGPGLDPTGPRKGKDIANAAFLLDSNTFTTLPLAGTPRYHFWQDADGNLIDWREPVRHIVDRYRQEIEATTDGESITYLGFNIVEEPTRSFFRPGEPVGGLPTGIAWEFTAQVVLVMNFVDQLYHTQEFEVDALKYLEQIGVAQASAPYGDGRGLVASTLNRENDAPDAGYPPLDQCLGTPFQCIAERVGLAATTWAIFAEENINIFNIQRNLPTSPAPLVLEAVSPTEVLATWSDSQYEVGYRLFQWDGAKGVEVATLFADETDYRITDLAPDTLYSFSVEAFNSKGSAFAGWDTVMTLRLADLNRNGFVDFEDLTILLANWNKNVSAVQGNIVNPDATPVNFNDLTVLLAAWTGPGAGAAVGVANGQLAVAAGSIGRDDDATGPNVDRTVAAGEVFDRLGRRDSSRRAAIGRRDGGRAGLVSPLRRLQAVAVDRAMHDSPADEWARRQVIFVRRTNRA